MNFAYQLFQILDLSYQHEIVCCDIIFRQLRLIVKKSLAFRRENDYLRKMLLLLSKCLITLKELNNTYFQVFDTVLREDFFR